MLVSLIVSSCDLINPPAEDPNVLNGDTNLEYTKQGYVSYAYINIDGASLPSGSMTVQSNEGGIVSYKLSFNLKGYKDSAAIATLLGPSNNDKNGNVFVNFKMKVTSEGIQDYYNREKPWTIVKYNDGVGTEYPYTTSDGEKLIRKITEKTGIDEWPYGMYLIKTTKIESDMPSDDKIAKKMVFRANHKFGLVYVEMLLKTDQTVKMKIL